MSRFTTLLQREWMQHQRGWLVLLLLPPALVLLIVPFGTVEVGPLPPLAFFLVATLAVTTVVVGIAAAAVLFQTPGLARRDRQDRSIEFWLSLPTGHAASIGATVLMHVVLLPLLALAVGAVASQIIGAVLIVKAFGPAAWFGLPWGALASAGAAALVRAALGVVLATFWLMPLVLLAMAASAWFKRWGTPIVLVALPVMHGVLKRFYGITVLDDTFQALLRNAGGALIHDLPRHHGEMNSGMAMDWLAGAPKSLLFDGLAALRDLAQPLALFAFVASACLFGLLVLRRSRNR